ncbi:NB-ARC domain-containing protein [Streptomyces sp. NPDC059837]|uniref:NB-ARC domain-containing protein n=1 Tax=Streptomyces sp. NPDC059837 TaxID=3346968 RepID=UPI003661EA99
MTILLAVLVVFFTILGIVAERRPEPAFRSDPHSPNPPTVQDHFVPREQTREVVSAVCAGRRQVGITTSLLGAGGFGKTMLAKDVCRQETVRHHFDDRVYYLTMGRDVRTRTEIAAKVADMVTLITGDGTKTPATDGDAAGAYLGRLLDERPRILLVLDDVWDERQLAPFLIGGPQCVRLITTRIANLLPPGAARVTVDQMTPEQAKRVLTSDLAPLSRPLADSLLKATGRWALLLRLANRTIATDIEAGTEKSEAAENLLRRLREWGPSAANDPDHSWNLDDPDLRNLAVEASVDAAVTLLTLPGAADRFTELATFAEGEPIPITLATALWQSTGSLAVDEARRVCRALARLSLITYEPAEGRIGLHDVIREHLRARIGPHALTRLHATLVDAVAARLPTAGSLAQGSPHPGHAWWRVPEGYLHDNLIRHLLAAGRRAQAEAIAGDIRWVEMRLSQRGPNAPWNDLICINTPSSSALAHSLAQNAHLITLNEPTHAQTQQLYIRLQENSHWGPQINVRRTCSPLFPRLACRWPLPDVTPAAQRTLTGHTGPVRSVAWSVDGRLASGSADNSLRVWDVATGASAEFAAHTGHVNSVAWSASGRVATGSADGTARSWHVTPPVYATWFSDIYAGVKSVAWSVDGRLAIAAYQMVLVWDENTTVHAYVRHSCLGFATSVAWSHDGRLAIADVYGTVEVWDVGTDISTTLSGHTDWVRSVAWSTDGRLASGGNDETVRVWDVNTGTSITLTGHTDWVNSVAWSADGRLASASNDETVRIWDVGAAVTPASPAAHTGAVRSVAWSADGRLASGGSDRTLRLWDVSTGDATILTGHRSDVLSVAWAADGQLATSSLDQSVWIWNVGTGDRTRLFVPDDIHDWVSSLAWSADRRLATAIHDERASGSIYEGTVRVWNLDTGDFITLTGHTKTVESLAWSADGRLATASSDHTIRIWNVDTGTSTVLTGHSSEVLTVAWSADGRLATASSDQTIRIWNVGTGTSTTLTDHTGLVTSVAWSADGWLATASSDQTIRIWNATERRMLAALQTDGAVHSCSWSPAEPLLAAGGERGLFLLDFLTT